MKRFTTVIKKVSVAVIYILVWHLASVCIDNRILIAGPVEVLAAIIRIVQTEEFILIIKNSLCNILSGFILALIFSVILAFIAFYCEYIRMLVKPLVHIFKSVPVASFIILMLIWMGSEGIAKGISFIIAVPVIYTGVMQGLSDIDKKLLEMAQVYRMSAVKKVYYIYLCQIKEKLKSSAVLALGMCFKAGIAAEVIGVAKNTLGEQIYLSKIYLSTDELFGWTIIIVLLSYVMELFVKLIFSIGDIYGKRKA